MHLAAKSGSAEAVQYLLSDKAIKPTLTDNKGNTALHFAVQARQVDTVRVLVEDSRIDGSAVNKDGQTAKDLTFQEPHEDDIIKQIRRLLDGEGLPPTEADEGEDVQEERLVPRSTEPVIRQTSAHHPSLDASVILVSSPAPLVSSKISLSKKEKRKHGKVEERLSVVRRLMDEINHVGNDSHSDHEEYEKVVRANKKVKTTPQHKGYSDGVGSSQMQETAVGQVFPGTATSSIVGPSFDEKHINKILRNRIALLQADLHRSRFFFEPDLDQLFGLSPSAALSQCDAALNQLEKARHMILERRRRLSVERSECHICYGDAELTVPCCGELCLCGACFEAMKASARDCHSNRIGSSSSCTDLDVKVVCPSCQMEIKY